MERPSKVRGTLSFMARHMYRNSPLPRRSALSMQLGAFSAGERAHLSLSVTQAALILAYAASAQRSWSGHT